MDGLSSPSNAAAPLSHARAKRLPLSEGADSTRGMSAASPPNSASRGKGQRSEVDELGEEAGGDLLAIAAVGRGKTSSSRTANRAEARGMRIGVAGGGSVKHAASSSIGSGKSGNQPACSMAESVRGLSAPES